MSLQVVTNLQNQLRDRPGYLGPAVSEGFLRRYQVLPGRTHPMMNASGSGGFILHVIKMCVLPLVIRIIRLTSGDVATTTRRRCRLCSIGIARRRSWTVRRRLQRPLQMKEKMMTRKRPLLRQRTRRLRMLICGHCRAGTTVMCICLYHNTLHLEHC